MTIENGVNDRVLAALRIAVGVFFCVFGEYKVFGTEFTLHGGFQDGVRGFLTSGIRELDDSCPLLPRIHLREDGEGLVGSLAQEGQPVSNLNIDRCPAR